MIRFHFDEHLSHEIASGLRLRGIDVTTATDADLLGADDDTHLAFALREQRVLVTNDADYLRLAKAGAAHAGIVYYRRGTRSIGFVVRELSLLYECMTPGQMLDHIEYI